MTTELAQDDFFKLDVELHLMASLEHYDYFPKVVHRKRLHLPWRAIFGPQKDIGQHPDASVSFWETAGREGVPTPEDLIGLMDKYGVDLACLLPEVMSFLTGYSSRWSSNGQVSEACAKYPDRFIFQPNVGPLKRRGLKEALWELEYLVKERNAKMVKFFPGEDTYINDPEIWPFYQKVLELDIPVCIHTGVEWAPNCRAKYSHPALLEDVLIDFPELKVIAYHFGWPHFFELDVIAARWPNVYIGTSLLQTWALSKPRRFAEMIGEAMQCVGSDRIVWGTDGGTRPEPAIRYSVRGLREFQMPEDMLEGYGYERLTDEDRRKIFGLNLARLLKIEPKRRVPAGSGLAQAGAGGQRAG